MVSIGLTLDSKAFTLQKMPVALQFDNSIGCTTRISKFLPPSKHNAMARLARLACKSPHVHREKLRNSQNAFENLDTSRKQKFKEKSHVVE